MTVAGRPEVFLTPAAKLAARVHGLAPGPTLRALAVVDRLLPGGTATEKRPGRAVDDDPAWLRLLTAPTRRAARRLHQFRH
jgi:hypothetical protein